MGAGIAECGKAFPLRLSTDLNGVIASHPSQAGVRGGLVIFGVLIGSKMAGGPSESASRSIAAEYDLWKQLRSRKASAPAKLALVVGRGQKDLVHMESSEAGNSSDEWHDATLIAQPEAGGCRTPEGS